MNKNFLKFASAAAAILLAVSAFPVFAGAEESIPDPVAWYDFEDADDFGKDKMGKYNMDCANGNGSAEKGIGAVGNGIKLDGDYCLALPKDNDLSKKLKSFTLSYYAIRQQRIADYRAWETPVSFGQMRIMHRIDSADEDYIHITYDPNDWWNLVKLERFALTSALNMYTFTVNVGGGKTHVDYYLNGVKYAEKDFDKELSFGSDGTTFAIGAMANADEWYYADNGGCFTGVIDEVKVFDKVLTADQILAMFNSENPNGAKSVDVVFPIDIPIVDDDTSEEDAETSEPVSTDKPQTPDSSDETSGKTPAATSGTPADSGKTPDETDGGLSPAVIVVIVVAAVLAAAAVVLGIISAKKKKTK